jgi:hypothetical protein
MKSYFIGAVVERVLLTKEEFVLEASTEAELNVMRVKAYRAAAEMREKTPDIDSRIDIHQDKQALTLTIGPATKPKIFVRQQDGSLTPFELPDEHSLKQVGRILELMQRDGLSSEEMLAALTPEQAVLAKSLLEKEA